MPLQRFRGERQSRQRPGPQHAGNHAAQKRAELEFVPVRCQEVLALLPLTSSVDLACNQLEAISIGGNKPPQGRPRVFAGWPKACPPQALCRMTFGPLGQGLEAAAIVAS